MGDECFFKRLPDLIDDAPDFDFLKTQFLPLAQILEVNETFVRGLRNDMVNGTKSYSDVVKSILQRWRDKNGNAVTVEKLCSIMALQEEWNEVAVFLLQNYSAMISTQIPEDLYERTHGKITYFPSKILGKGSSNTMVYQGKFEGRKVAVKNIFCQIDDEKRYKSEINTLLECDGHKNVVKYFAMEVITGGALQVFLALELCNTTLGSWIYKKYSFDVDLKHLSILKQVTKGLAHLHAKNIIHRDIKPDNILLKKESDSFVRVKITDFGISRRVPIDRSKVTVVTHTGTDGWKAPEILKVESESLNGNAGRSYQSPATDIFSLGCLFYYVLTEGVHPFGENPIKIQFRILVYKPQVKLYDLLQNPEWYKHIGALRLIFMMIAEDPEKRPPVDAILKHHLFWKHDTTVRFVTDVNNVLHDVVDESIEDLCWKKLEECPLLHPYILSGWHSILTPEVQKYISNQNGTNRRENKRGRYEVKLLRDLIRLIRNLECHLKTQSKELIKELGEKRENYLKYWQERFPFLIDSMWMKFERIK